MLCLPPAAALIANKSSNHRSTGHNRRFAAGLSVKDDAGRNTIAIESARMKSTAKFAWIVLGNGGPGILIIGRGIATPTRKLSMRTGRNNAGVTRHDACPILQTTTLWNERAFCRINEFSDAYGRSDQQPSPVACRGLVVAPHRPVSAHGHAHHREVSGGARAEAGPAATC